MDNHIKTNICYVYIYVCIVNKFNKFIMITIHCKPVLASPAKECFPRTPQKGRSQLEEISIIEILHWQPFCALVSRAIPVKAAPNPKEDLTAEMESAEVAGSNSPKALKRGLKAMCSLLEFPDCCKPMTILLAGRG